MTQLDPDRLDSWIAKHVGEIIEVRRDIHAHPELGFDTPLTVHALRAPLVDAGLAPVDFPGGLYVDIGPSGDEPRVGLRADIDALPLPETTGLPWASVFADRSHACGHDVHAAVALGAALALADQPALPGGVRVIFQPAEETLGGARTVVERGILDPLEQVFALHCEPHAEVGVLGTRLGAITSACDYLEIRLRGSGGHTARPHLTADIVNALGRVVTELPAMLSRRCDPRAGMSMVFGSVHAGVAANAIPAEGTLTGTLRVLSMEEWRGAEKLVREIVESVVAGTGASLEIDYEPGVPPVHNDVESHLILRHAMASVVGESQVYTPEQSLGGEDFAWYGEKTKIALGRLGVRRPGTPITDLHQGGFVADDAAIEYGIATLVRAAVGALG